MRIALAQINYHIGNFESNIAKVKSAISRSKAEDAELVVFSELSICGYPPRDFLEFDDFILLCEQGIEEIAKECIGIAAIIGAPEKNNNPKGKGLYNSAFFLSDGKVQSIHRKALLPTYDIFDEYRYFEPCNEFQVVEFGNKKIAITVCEDLWNVGGKQLYKDCPMNHLSKQDPDVIINISASPFTYEHDIERKIAFKENALKYKMPIVFVNHVGAQTELIFDGGSFQMSKNGKIVKQLKYFEEDLQIVDINNGAKEEKNEQESYTKTAKIYHALVLGIRDYFHKSGLGKAILGLSGGIDSAVTLVLAERALGKENVKAVLMPSKFSSDHSVSDAKQLVENLGCPHELIGIEEITKAFDNSLKTQFEGTEFGLAEENMQARARGVLLMALANKFGYILLNTSNKSETAVGYGTLYGDMAGGLSVLGDVYKTEVYELANFINRDKIIIPSNIITKPPSAELRPNQKDTDSLPEYEILDKILYQYIELLKGPGDIMKLGYDKNLVRKVLKLINTNEYKRVQTPPILRVSSKAFGMGRRMPITGRYLS